jgi:UDP:flavonoid glycosyltransferase YjiC (YdhE family)
VGTGSSRRRFLVTTLPTNDLGLLARGLPVAMALRDRGHEVVFASPAAAPRRVVDEAGFRNESPRHALYALIDADPTVGGLLRFLLTRGPARAGLRTLPFLRDVVTSAPRRRAPATPDVHDTDHAGAVMGMLDLRFVRANVLAYQRLLDEVRPDVVLDLWNPLAVMAARSRGVPVATLIQADAHPASGGFRWWAPRPPGLPDPVPVVNEVAAEVGLPAVDRVADWCVGDVTLVTGTPRTDPLPAGVDVTYVGALLWEQPVDRLPPGVQRLPAGKPVVWVYSGNPSYGRAGRSMDSLVVLEACLAALVGQEITVVLTTGHHDLPGHLLPLPAGFHHEPWVPGPPMAERSDLLLHHGGYGSCQTGFWTGTPAVVLPTFSERESNARRVAALGAGEMVPVAAGPDHVKTVDEERLRSTVRRVLDAPRYAAAAAAVGEELRAYGGPSAAADHVEVLARAG